MRNYFLDIVEEKNKKQASNIPSVITFGDIIGYPSQIFFDYTICIPEDAIQTPIDVNTPPMDRKNVKSTHK